ncbi:MAG: hypothetical protein P4M14_10660 [Gammaproteobacteria bacterium]|nr:hypothetical protein [Gammaproteobacteria bacterium]
MRYMSTFIYITFIILVNNIFTYAPVLMVFGAPFSSADAVVGVVYIMRDFSQRELGHYVIFAMLLGCFLSYILADKAVALASVLSFFVGEVIDWLVFTYTKKPLSQRLLSSSLICAPIDSSVFLYMVDQLNVVGVVVLTLSKTIGVLAVWLIWRTRMRHKQNSLQVAACV